MGLINTLFGNASEMQPEALQQEFGPLLCADERIEKAYKLLRDKWIFTNKRLIIQDVQGVTGKKREYMSVPYRSVERFSVETAGTFDMDCDRGEMRNLAVEARYADELARHRRLLREWMEKHPAPRREKHLGLIPR